jgi:hypothetical protein
MRFYTGSHEYLHKASSTRDIFDQFLYLVPEVNNQYDVNTIMLHNGKQKLGSVEAHSAAPIRQLMEKWKNEGGSGEDVVVCSMDSFYDSGLQEFKHRGSLKVRGMYRVNERLARKFSKKNLKE